MLREIISEVEVIGNDAEYLLNLNKLYNLGKHGNLDAYCKLQRIIRADSDTLYFITVAVEFCKSENIALQLQAMFEDWPVHQIDLILQAKTSV